MTTTLAPPHAVHPETPGSAASAHRAAAAPRVTAVLLVRGDALGRPAASEEASDSGMRVAATTRIGRLPEVLDALAAQTRPPERLVVVAAADAVAGADADAAVASNPAVASTGSASVLTRVTELVEAHERLVAAVPEVAVIGLPAPADLGGAVDAALAELDRRNAPGESVPDASADKAARAAESPDTGEAPESADTPDSAEAADSTKAPEWVGGESAESAESAETLNETEAGPADVEAESDEAAAADDEGKAGPEASEDATPQGEPESEPAPSPTEPPATPSSSTTPTGPEWLWVLEDTVAPQPTALRRLVEAVRRSPS
ncbi:MAG TPA: hypothetical protein VIE19_10775, partial [Lapillicoccus sp.]